MHTHRWGVGACACKVIHRRNWQMKLTSLIVLGVLAVVAGIWVKAWQCEEMFPGANVVACVMWR